MIRVMFANSLDETAWPDLVPALKALPEGLRALARLECGSAGVLAHQGSVPQSIFCVLRGELRLVRHDRDGHELIVQRVVRGFVAEASLDMPAYHCHVMVAARASRWLRWPVAAFRQALVEDPNFQTAWRGVLAQEVRRLRAQTERLMLHSAAERVLHYVACEGRSGALRLSQPRNAWAAELGLSPETLYRTLRRLRETGRLRIEAETFYLV